MTSNAPTFPRQDPLKFFKTLNTKVNEYFKENNLKKTGNWRLYLKTLIMFSLLFLPYFIILFFVTIPFWQHLLCSFVMGVGMAGVGMNVMHDGNHGSYSTIPWVNKFMGGSIYILAGNVYNWQVQHNVLHHTYTNIHGHDEDLDAGRIIRFTKQAQWYSFHKFQHYYAIFAYGLLTINWCLTTDFKQMGGYLKRKLYYGTPPNTTNLWTGLVISKIVYFSFWIIIPIVYLTWWKVLVGFFVMHYTAGLILSLVFQLAHVVEETDNPTPNELNEMENTWAIHQLYTTVNFAPKNWFLNYYTGGLNHQIEHHLYPNISHIHYSKIAEFVKQTAKECSLPYFEYKTMTSAVIEHVKHLKDLGTKPEII